MRNYLPLVLFVGGGALFFVLLTSTENTPPAPAKAAVEGKTPDKPTAAVKKEASPQAPASPTTKQGATEAAAKVKAGAAKAGFNVFFAGNAMGELIDCGCRANPLGGLARRVRWTKEHNVGAHLDAGGSLVADPSNPGADAALTRERADIYLRALAQAPQRALNVAPAELAIGPKLLQELAKSRGVPLLASNTSREDGQPTGFERVLVREMGGLKVALLGLSSNRRRIKGLYSKNGLKLRDPVMAARELARGVRPQVDLIIALSWLTIEEIDDVADAVPEIDFLIGCRDTDLLQRAEFMGRGYRLDSYHKGKWLGRLTLRAGEVPGDKRWYDPKLMDLIDGRIGSLGRQIDYYAKKHKEEDAAGGPKDADNRRFERERAVGLRAILMRTQQERKRLTTAPAGANTFEVKLEPVRTSLPEDEQVVQWVEAFKKRFPSALRSTPGH